MHTTSRCITPSVKRTPCGPRVLLCQLHVHLFLDAPDAEDLVLRRLLLDEVGEAVSDWMMVRYEPRVHLFQTCLEKEEPLVKPGPLLFHLLQISLSIWLTFEA